MSDAFSVNNTSAKLDYPVGLMTIDELSYAGGERIRTNKQPTYNCTNMSDAFSVNNTSAKLDYPVGLMTIDELSYAGGQAWTKLTAPYAWYYTNANGESSYGSAPFWAFSPSCTGSPSRVWGVSGSGRPASTKDIYWRIIRTNADGSIKLLYAGTSPDTEKAYIGMSAFNTSYNNPMYVGYKYGTTGSLENNRLNMKQNVHLQIFAMLVKMAMQLV
ncbi:unknown [Clostridium sp. CAG:628]|nr:unknown [Clostridium sp. CAG:628]